jgi:hypothetical protein
MIPSASPACRAPTATPCAESARLRRHDRPASVTATTMHTDSCDDRGRHPTEHRRHAGGKGIGRMSVTPNEYVCAPDLVAAARESIRREGDCVVSIWWLLDEMTDKFGDRFTVSPDTYKVLDLIETLWGDSHVDQVPGTETIEFVWNEKGSDQVPVNGLKARLLGRFQIPSPTKEEA